MIDVAGSHQLRDVGRVTSVWNPGDFAVELLLRTRQRGQARRYRGSSFRILGRIV